MRSSALRSTYINYTQGEMFCQAEEKIVIISLEKAHSFTILFHSSVIFGEKNCYSYIINNIHRAGCILVKIMYCNKRREEI